MFCAAAEETQDNLIQGRGDAYCGMLNASYNLQLRNVKAYIPEYPVGDAEDCADMIHDFLPIARAVEGLSNLKIISFRTSSYRTSLLVMRRSNSFTTLELRLKRILNLTCLKHSTNMPEMRESLQLLKKWKKNWVQETRNLRFLRKLAQYELTLKDWVEAHRGYRKYVTLTGQMLACIPDTVWICSLLCKQPSDCSGHSGILRS